VVKNGVVENGVAKDGGCAGKEWRSEKLMW
jgi:hypothetical protein